MISMIGNTETKPYHTIIVGFTGWCDAGAVVHYTMNHIIETCDARELGRWEIEPYLHIEQERPHIRIHHGIVQGLTWPSITFYSLYHKETRKHLIAVGQEPSYNWRAFSREFINRLRHLGIRQIIILGSLYDQVFHDEAFASAVVMTPTALNIARSAGCKLLQYEGPAAIHGALMIEAQDAGIEAIALWSHVPFYLKGPHEKAMAHLIGVISKITGANFPAGSLMEQWNMRVKQLEKLIEEDEELRNLIDTLKHQERPSIRALPPPESMTVPPQPPKIIHIDEFIRKKRETNNTEKD